MCGRFSQGEPTRHISEYFGAYPDDDLPDGLFNMTAHRADPDDCESRRGTAPGRGDLGIPALLARRRRREELDQRPDGAGGRLTSVRPALRTHWCVIPADAFYESGTEAPRRASPTPSVPRGRARCWRWPASGASPAMEPGRQRHPDHVAVRPRDADSQPLAGHPAARPPRSASSGKTVRHRLNRAGDRQANCALTMVVLTREGHDPRTRAYVRRRTAEGKTTKEIMPCLKRYVAREVYGILLQSLGLTT